MKQDTTGYRPLGWFLLRSWRNKDRPVGPQRPERFRPRVECLEDRLAPATFNLAVNPAVNPGGAVTELVNAISTANGNHQTNTINLFAGGDYDLTAINNYWYGPDGLPGDFEHADDQRSGGHDPARRGRGRFPPVLRLRQL